MASNISSSGVDLDSLFAARVSAARPIVNYQVLGTDISQRYESISSANYTLSATPPTIFIGQRIPIVTNIKANSTDLSSLFCGNASLYSITAPAFSPTNIVARTLPWSTTVVFTFTATWSTTVNFTSFWANGGRIQLSASRVGGSATLGNAAITNLLSLNLGTVVVADTATYITGSGVNSVTTSTRYGGTNFPVALTNIASVTGQASPYAADVVVVQGQTNVSQNRITISMRITPADSGVVFNPIDGTLTPSVQYRVYTGNNTYPSFNVTQNF